MSHDTDFQNWIKKTIYKIIESFGSNITDIQYDVKETSDVCMTTMYFVCVKFKNRLTSQCEEHSMILKRSIQDEIWRKMINNDLQFHNEILFYRLYVQPGENFPRCFYTDEKPGDSLIALENVNERGYYPCSHKYPDIPLEYTLAAMREIGRFHGKGYAMKELQKESFFHIVEQLQHVRFGKPVNENIRSFVNFHAMRVVEYLRRQDHDTTFCDKMEALFSNAFDEIMLKTIKPLEPLSTLCHGDFTLNNMLFKIENNGQHRAMLIDFALLSYSTPVIDLSTYLCLYCSNEIWKNKFTEIMRAYHDTLKEYLLNAGVWNVEKYSYDAILDDFRRGGLFGFVIASFFLPTLMGYVGENYKEDLTDVDPSEYRHIYKKYGGDDVPKTLAEILFCLKDLGCLERYL